MLDIRHFTQDCGEVLEQVPACSGEFGSGFRVMVFGSGFRVLVQGSGFWFLVFGSGFWYLVQGSGFWFRVQGLRPAPSRS